MPTATTSSPTSGVSAASSRPSTTTRCGSVSHQRRSTTPSPHCSAVDGLFERFPRLRVATIESGSDWVGPLLAKLQKAYGQMPTEFGSDPVEQFRRHVWVAPYYEDDLEGLKGRIGADHILFGSDYPHAEGLAVPTDFVHDLEGYDTEAVRLVMRENALGLLRPA